MSISNATGVKLHLWLFHIHRSQSTKARCRVRSDCGFAVYQWKFNTRLHGSVPPQALSSKKCCAGKLSGRIGDPKFLSILRVSCQTAMFAESMEKIRVFGGKIHGFRPSDRPPWVAHHRRLPKPEPKIPIGSLCIDDCSMRNSFNALNILVTLVPTHIYVRRPESSTCN